MSEVTVYGRKRKTKEQCCSVPGTPEKPTPQRPKIDRVYRRQSRMKLHEKAFDQSSWNEKNTDCDKSSETVLKMISSVQKDVLFDPCMALSEKEKEQSSDRTEKRSKLDLTTSLNSPVAEEEQNFAPGLDLDVHSFDGNKDLRLEKEHSLNGTFSALGGSIDSVKSVFSLGNDDGLIPPLTQTDEGLISGIEVLHVPEKDWDSVLIDNNPFRKLPCLFESKASQPYAISKDNGFMRESVIYNQFLGNGCFESKKHKQIKKKIHRPKVAFDRKLTAPKSQTLNQAKEKKARCAREKKLTTPNFVTPKKPRRLSTTKEKKTKQAIAKQTRAEKVRGQTSPNLEEIKNSLIIQINETKAPHGIKATVARVLDFRLKSLDTQPEPVDSDIFKLVEYDPFSFPIKKRRSKRRGRLNWFSFPVINVKESFKKQKKQFTIKWSLRRRRRIRTNRGRKITEAKTNVTDEKITNELPEALDAKTNPTDEMDLPQKVTGALDAKSNATNEADLLQKIEVLEVDTPVTGKRKHKENTLKPRGRGELLSNKDIDSVVKKLQSLHISDNTLVPYRGSSRRRKNIVPNVVLDLENVRVYNSLMGVDVDQIKNEASEETEKWWEREREVYARRATFFISTLQPIQGDRSFRKWNGSVLDSVIGVFLTQNAMDHLSSNAFLSLAAMFPVKSASSESDLRHELVGRNLTEYDGNQYFVNDPEPEKNKEFEKSTDDLICELEETRMNTACKGCLPMINNTDLPTNSEADLHGGLVGELEGCLQPLSSIPDLNDACNSIVQRPETKRLKDFHTKIPKLKQRDYSNMGIGKRKSTPKQKGNALKEDEIDWESIRTKYSTGGRSSNQMDIVDWEAVRLVDVKILALCIKERGQQNEIAANIQNLLNRLVNLHNCLDLEWLLKTPPDLAKRYLLEIYGLGLKSVECIRLLALEQVAFPVDVNVARIVVRLGWVPLQPLPGELQLHLLNLYPILDKIQIYLWPRLCNLPQRILYILHFHMITFGKVFCTKVNPNCNACPLRDHCKHYQSQNASAKKALPSNKMKSSSTSSPRSSAASLSSRDTHLLDIESHPKIYEYIIEEPFESPPTFDVPESPEPEFQEPEYEYDSDGIHTYKLNVQPDLIYGDGERSNALVVLNSKAAFTGAPRLKIHRRLRTEHLVYELPRNHILLEGLEQTESDDDLQYHLAIWIPGDIAKSSETPKKRCNSTGSELCNEETCFTCNNIRETKADLVRGTLLIPYRVACQGKFPLNGTYFQLNEVFADDETSHRPINVRRKDIYNLRRRIAHFGASIHAITRGESQANIRECFLRDIICVRAFDRSGGGPKNLTERFRDTKGVAKKNNKDKVKKEQKVTVRKAIKW